MSKDSTKSQKTVSELSVINEKVKAIIYGYARVSTATQGRDGNSLEDQANALEKYGCQEIVQEAFSGKTMDRPKFQSILETLQEGDTLVVCKLDRFAWTAIEGVQTVWDLFDRGVKVHILNMGLMENTLTGNLILTVMLAFAEYERGMIVERTQTEKPLPGKIPTSMMEDKRNTHRSRYNLLWIFWRVERHTSK